MVNWCWDRGICVRYGRLFDNGSIVTSGRFSCSDIDSLSSRFVLQETTPEELGLTRDCSCEECSSFNDFKFPAEFPTVIPPRLILDVKNNVTNRDLAPQTVAFELRANPEIDRVEIVKTIWNFGDGTPLVEQEGLFGSAPGFRQNHTYENPVNFNGTVTLQILDVDRNVIDSETSTFSGVILAEPQITPLNIIVDIFSDSEQAPANVRLEIIGNQAIEDISINYGDGTPLTTNQNHTYQLNGNYQITVAATSKLSGERSTTTREFNLALPPAPPGENQIIFEVRRTETSSFPVAPTTVNYKVTLNPKFLTRLFGIRVTWFNIDRLAFQSLINDGDKVTGLNQSFNYDIVGFKNVSVTIEVFEKVITLGTTQSIFFNQEVFNDTFEIFAEQIQVPKEPEPPFEEPPEPEPPIIECIPGFHEENGVCVPNPPPVDSCPIGSHDEDGICVPDTIDCTVGSHEEGGVCVPNILPTNNTTRNIAITGVVIAAGVAAIVVSRR